MSPLHKASPSCRVSREHNRRMNVNTGVVQLQHRWHAHLVNQQQKSHGHLLSPSLLCSGFPPSPRAQFNPVGLFYSTVCRQTSWRARVEAVCKEVQHQAFCQTRPGLRVRLTHRPHHKQEQPEERKGGVMREICDVCTYKYIMHSKHKTHFPKHMTPISLSLSLLLSVLPNVFAGSVQVWKRPKKNPKQNRKPKICNFHQPASLLKHQNDA